MNQTCLLSDALHNFENLNKRGKSLNRTGMVMINENEDIVDYDNTPNTVFFHQKKDSVVPSSDEEPEKSKTTNVADLLKEI